MSAPPMRQGAISQRSFSTGDASTNQGPEPQILCQNSIRPCQRAIVTIAAPSCLIQRHFLQLSATLADRCEQLQLELSDQVASLPFGNERWLLTERELSAAEDALLRLHDRVDQLVSIP